MFWLIKLYVFGWFVCEFGVVSVLGIVFIFLVVIWLIRYYVFCFGFFVKKKKLIRYCMCIVLIKMVIVFYS